MSRDSCPYIFSLLNKLIGSHIQCNSFILVLLFMFVNLNGIKGLRLESTFYFKAKTIFGIGRTFHKLEVLPRSLFLVNRVFRVIFSSFGIGSSVVNHPQ